MNALSRPEAYTPPFRPYAHQEEALRLLDGEEAFALFMGMRTGKTKVVLDHYGRLELRGECQNLCVIAPGGVYKTWGPAAIGGTEAVPVGHLSDDLKSRVLIHEWVSGPNAGQRKALEKFMAATDRPRIFLINVEALSSVKAAKEVLIKFLKQGKVLTAVDESIIIKNPTSKRTKFINKEVANESDFRLILSGLPNPKNPLDYYAQFEFLDWRFLGFRSFYAFRGRYAVMISENIGGRMIPMIKGWRDLDDLAAKIDPHCYRKQLKDCYDVPPKLYLFHDVEMTPEQERIYADMKAFATAQLDGQSHVTATVVIAQIMRLRQILCGFTKDEEGRTHYIPENRTSDLVERLEDYDGKAIIWCAFGESVEQLRERLAQRFGREAVACFWGGNIKTREAEEEQFKTNPECRFMIATAAAGGRGRTWTVADLIIYHSCSDDLDHRDQSEERGSGIGKDDRVTVVDMRVKGTVEDKLIKNLRNKIDLATAVNGEGYRAWLI